ncbi:MAG: hypothetical protein ABIB43_03695 [archaeon]
MHNITDKDIKEQEALTDICDYAVLLKKWRGDAVGCELAGDFPWGADSRELKALGYYCVCTHSYDTGHISLDTEINKVLMYGCKKRVSK